MPTWIGGRPAIEYVVTITIGGTWIAGETLSVTIDGVALTLTIGTAVATTDVATALAAAWEASALGTGYSANFLGTESGRHYELQASVSGSVVTLTERAFDSVTEGKQFPSLSVSEASASGTITLGTPSTPTGPYNWTDAANWLEGVVPVNTDEIDITGPYDIRDGLDQSAVLATATIRIPASYTGSIGLPRLRSVTLPSGVVDSFGEYRRTFLITDNGATITVYIGDGDGEGSPMIKLDFGGNGGSVTLYASATPTVESEPAVFLAGMNSAGVTQFGGTLGIDFYPEDTTSILTFVYVTTRAGIASSPVLVIGNVATVVIAGSVKGGTATLNHALTASEVWQSHDGGVVNVRGGVHSSALLKAYGGRINLDAAGGTLGTLNLAAGSPGFAGSVVIAGGGAALTITNCTIYSAGCSLVLDGRRAVTFTNNIKLTPGLPRSQVTVDMPLNSVATLVEQTALA